MVDTRALTASTTLAGSGFNPKTLSAPAVFRGQADASTYPGVTTGVLANSAARQANGIALQAFLDYCSTNKLVAYFPALRFEYEATANQGGRNTGLHAKNNIGGVIGESGNATYGTRLVQYAVNHPVLTIGDVGATSSYGLQSIKIGHFALGHGVSQTGQTSADGLLLGSLYYSDFIGLVTITPFMQGVFPPYIGLQIGLSLTQIFFSNVGMNFLIFASQMSYIKNNAGGTGNAWLSAYCGNGGPGNRVAMIGTPVDLGPSGVDHGFIGILNIEWTNSSGGPAAALTSAGDGTTIGHLHIEGVVIDGNYDRALINVVEGRLNINSMKCLDVWIKSGVVSGTPKIFTQYGNSRLNVDACYLRWTGTGELVADAPFQLFDDGFSPIGYRTSVSINKGGCFGNTGSFRLDPTMPSAVPGAANNIAAWGNYEYNPSRSRTTDAVITMANAGLTVYGQHRNCQIRLRTALTANQALVLSDKLAANGAGSASVRPAGDFVEVFREGGGAFDVVVNTQSGALLHTFTGAASANTIKRFEWSGSAWTALA